MDGWANRWSVLWARWNFYFDDEGGLLLIGRRPSKRFPPAKMMVGSGFLLGQKFCTRTSEKFSC